MAIPQLNDGYYFHLSVTERVHSPHEIYLKIHEQTTKPGGPNVTFTKVADYSGGKMYADPATLIEEAIERLYSNTPQYFKGFEHPKEKFTRALADVIQSQPQAEDTPARLNYPDFLDPEKMNEITAYGLFSVLRNYCEVLPNTIKNIRPSLSNAQTIAVLTVLERLSTADRPAPETDDLYNALPIVLESARSGEYFDLSESQWEAVEHYYALLAKKVGLVARNADGDVIVLPEHKDNLD